MTVCAAACRRLWQAALVEKLRAASGDLGSGLNPTARLATSRHFKTWIGSTDFLGHCDLAGMDPEAVHAAYQRGAFAAGQWRKERA